MTVQTTSGVQASVPAGQPAMRTTTGSQGLGEVFMQLLLKQLGNQDPMQTVTGTDFVIQLAQLSMLEQIQQMNTSLRSFLDIQQLTQASQLIGKTVHGLSADGLPVEGVVSAARLMNGVAVLDIGEHTIPLRQVELVSDKVTR